MESKSLKQQRDDEYAELEKITTKALEDLAQAQLEALLEIRQ